MQFCLSQIASFLLVLADNHIERKLLLWQTFLSEESFFVNDSLVEVKIRRYKFTEAHFYYQQLSMSSSQDNRISTFKTFTCLIKYP